MASKIHRTTIVPATSESVIFFTSRGEPRMTGQRSWMSVGTRSSIRWTLPLNMPVEAMPIGTKRSGGCVRDEWRERERGYRGSVWALCLECVCSLTAGRLDDERHREALVKDA